MTAGRRVVAISLAILIALDGGASAAAQVLGPPSQEGRLEQAGGVSAPQLVGSAAGLVASTKHPKLDSRLVQLAQTANERGTASALQLSGSQRLKATDAGVQVVIEAAAGLGRSGARAALQATGGRVEAEYENLVQATVPISALMPLVSNSSVGYVRPPFYPVLEAVADEAVGTTGASAWQAAAVTGSGVKIGIIDGGFGGYTSRQASGDLPASLTTQDFCSGQFTTASTHGAAVAEIVYKMAPGAQLYLICFGTEVQLGQAKDYAKSQGVQIVNHSVGWFNTSRGDGSGGAGTPDAIVADARASGILWVNSAGNHAQEHWSGTFSDTDGDGWHNFTPTDEGNTFFFPSGARVCIDLKWDNWPTSSQDYDLYLKRSSDGATLAASVNSQRGSQPPTEGLCYTNSATSQNFYVAIRKISATQSPRFDLYVSLGGPVLQYQVVAGSIIEPASSPSAMAVGAICWQNNALESYSSQGPTIDGRTKPDIAGQDSVSSGTYGAFSSCGTSGFVGTSASAPHVAGAAALVKQANPSFGPADIQSFLQARAIDLGPAGPDNQFGTGRLALGASAPTQLAFSTQPGGAAIGQVLTPAPVVAIEDGGGNVETSDNSSNVTVALTGSPAGVSLSGTKTVTVSGGLATFTGLRVDKAGTYSLTAITSAGGFTANSASFTVSPSSALSFSVQPVSLIAGTNGAGATVGAVADGTDTDTFGLTVTLQYPDGSAVPSGVTFSAAGASCALATCAVAGVGLNGTTAVNIALGNTTINVAGTYRLAASGSDSTKGTGKDSGGHTIVGATSAAFLVASATTPPAGSGVSFTAQPGSSTGGSALSPAPIVSLVTSTGVVVNDSTNTVTVTLANSSGAPIPSTQAALTSLSNAVTCSSTSNSCTTVLVSGVANFTGIRLNRAGTYELLASTSAPGASPAASNTFTVITPTSPPAGSLLSFTTQPGPSKAGSALSPAPIVSLVTSTGVVVNDSTNTVTVTLANSSGAPIPSTQAALTSLSNAVACSSTTNSCTTVLANGLANFTGITLTKTGPYVLLASTNAAGVSPATSELFTVSLNDDFAFASDVPIPGTVMGNTAAASTEGGEPSPICAPVGNTVWYRLAPSTTGSLTVSTAGSSFDTVLGLYTGASLSGLTRVDCNDNDPAGGSTSLLSATVTGGQTYYLQLGGRLGASGSFTLQLFFTNATVLLLSASTIEVGQSVTLAAVVGSTGGTPTGAVVFSDSGSALSDCGGATGSSLSGGVASCTIPAFTVGTHTITAAYAGSGSFASSTSAAATLTVVTPCTVGPCAGGGSAGGGGGAGAAGPAALACPGAAAYAICSSSVTPTPSFTGEAVNITANVSGSSSVPTGSISFVDTTTGANLCANVGFSSVGASPTGAGSGTALCTTAFATAGAHTISLTFSPSTGASVSASTGTTVLAVGTWVLRLTTPPGNGLGGGTLSSQPVVKLLDGPFSHVPTTGGNVTVQLLDQGGAPIPGTAAGLSQAGVPCPTGGAGNSICAISASAGVASFNLSVDKLLGPDAGRGSSTYSLAAGTDGAVAVGGVPVSPAGAQSAQFQVTTGPPSQLTFRDAPRGAAKAQFLHSALQIELDDAGGNPVVTDSTDTATVQLLDAATSSAPTAVSSTGTLTSTIGSAAPGRAAFNDLGITQNGDYILRVTSSAAVPSVDVGSTYAATGNPTYTTFNIGTPADSFRADPAQPVFIRDNQLVITAGPTKGVVDTALDPFVVQLTDASGVVQNSNATVILYATAPGVAAGGARKLVAPAYQSATFCPSNFATAQTGGCYVAEANLVAGRATFTGVVVPSLSSGAGRYSFTARLAPGSAPYTPAQVTCASYGAPSSGCVSGGNTAPGAWPSFEVSDKKLIFNRPPGGATTGQPLSQDPIVRLGTSAGTTMSDYYHTVTVSLADSAGNALAGPSLNATGCATGSTSCTAKVSSGAAALSGPSAVTAGTGSPNHSAQTVTAATSATLSFSTPGVQPVPLIAGTAGTGAMVTVKANDADDDTFILTVTLQYPDGSAVPSGVTYSTVGASCSLATCTVTGVILNATTAVNTALGLTTINAAGTYRLAASGGTIGGGANGTIDTASIAAATSTAFAVTAPAPPAGSQLSFSTPPGSSTGGTPLTPAPAVSLLTSTGVVQTTDSANTVSVTLANTFGVPVLFTQASLTSTNSAVSCNSASNSCTTVLVSGVAKFTGLTLNKAGSYTLLASTTAANTAPAISNVFTVSTGVGALLAQKSAPVGAAPGQPLQSQPRIELTDAGGNTLDSQTGGNVYATLNQCSSGVACATAQTPLNGAVLGGTTVAPIKKGIAQFAGLSINLAGDYVVVYTSDLGGVSQTTSGSMPLFIRPNQLRVSGVPDFMLTGQLMNGVVTVQLEDGAGNVIANSTDSVTIGATKSSKSQPLTGPGCASNKCTQPLVNGVAQFGGLTLGATAVAGTTSFKAEAPATNATFTPGALDNAGNTAPGGQSGKVTDWQVLWIANPGAADAGKALSPQPSVALASPAGVIQNDNTYSATIRLADKDGKAQTAAKLSGTSCATDGTCTRTFVNGIASFSGISVDTPGTYTLTANSNKVDGDNKLVVAITPSAQFIVGSVISSLTVSGSPNPSGLSQSVTITANTTTIGTFVGYAIGYMWFQDSANAQPICVPAAVTSSGSNNVTGTCTYAFTTAGTHTITAYYCPTFPTAATSDSGSPITYTCPSGGALGTYTQNVSSTAVSPKLSGPGCAADGLSCTVTLSNGGATFSGLSVDTVGTYTLMAVTNAISADGRSPAAVTSASFSVTAPSGNSGGGGNPGTSPGGSPGGAAGGAAPPAPPPAEALPPAPLAAEPPAPAPPPAATVPEAAPPSPPTISPEVADQLSSMLLNLGVASDADPETVLAALLAAAPPEVIDALQALSPQDQLTVVQQLLNPPAPPDQSLPDASSTPDAESAPAEALPSDTS